MQALLSFDRSPPLHAPMRFFLTAPVFGVLAGCLVLWSGWSELNVDATRWTPVVLAITHLITVGVMLQVMLGAMIQILPVVAGANLSRPVWVASVVHTLISLGALFLAAAFLNSSPLLFKISALLLGVGLAQFIWSVICALVGVPSTSPSIRGFKIAILGLLVTASLGVLLAAALGWSFKLSLIEVTDIHLGWGFVVWSTVLLASVAYVVVPMFQLTPPYPDRFGRWFSISVFAAMVLWTLSEYCGWHLASTGLCAAVVALSALFAGVTLNIQSRSKRPRFDPTQHYWRGAMLSALAACAVWLAAKTFPTLAESPAWPLLFGVLLLFGGFMSVIFGMLYKIVPFLIWLHLQERGRGRVVAPNMKKILDERPMNGQRITHFASCLLLLLAIAWPKEFDYLAGVAVVAANAWLLRNMLVAISAYRHHLIKIESLFNRAIGR